MSRSRLLLPLLATSALVLSACGGSGGDPSADPAAIVPAGSPIYLEANLKPGDEVKELAKKLSGEDDPGGAFKRWFEKQVADENPDFKFSEDVDPWLGERAGIFAPRISAGGDSAVGAIFSTKDADKAEESLEETLKQGDKGDEKPRVETRKHRDMEYFVDATDNDAAAIVEEYAVVGNEAAVKAVIDQSAGDSDSLSDTAEYQKARDSVDADGMGFVYVRLSQIFSALGPQGAVLRQGLKGLGETVAVGLDADESEIALETASLGVSGESAASGPGDVLAALPASSWFALGIADVGARIEQVIAQITQAGALGGQNPEELLNQIEAELGIDPRRDIASWMGDVAFFAFGDSLTEAGGGLIAASKDPDATRRAIPRIGRFLRQVAGMRARPLSREGIDTGITLISEGRPVPIHLALTDDDRFIAAVTDPGLAQALQDTDPLGESKPFKDAAASLGDGIQPQVFVNFAPLAGFVEGLGAGSDPTGQKAVEALKKLTTLAAGTKREGDVSRGKLVVGVK